MRLPKFITDRLFRWARDYIDRRSRPDFSIVPAGIASPYLCRWFVIPRNPIANMYLHLILESDDARALHDHPWCSCSIILRGGYLEHFADRVVERKAGDIVARCASTPHRLELKDGIPCVSLFLTVRAYLPLGSPKPGRGRSPFLEDLMSGKGFIAEDVFHEACELCGAIAELRPYGPNGEEVCFACGMKNEDAAKRGFRRLVMGKKEPPR